MKNLYITIIATLGCFGGYAQLQNANWHFGTQAGLSFLPNPYTPVSISSSQIDTNENCASVSDQEGNLLFYSNGQKVWDATNTVMPNGTGLFGNTSSTQGVVIVPKPQSDNYYIFTLDGYTGNSKGLYYSEVDMTNNDIIPTVKNIPLKDHNGTDIDEAYLNGSEKITTTKHSNGKQYWVIAHIRDKIYSYLVDSAGVSLIPVSSNAPLNIPSISLSDYFDVYSGPGQMKISPDGKKIGIAYYYESNSSEYGAIVLGAFDSSTGQIPSHNDFIQPEPGNYYGLEFSPSSDYVYFNIGGDLYRGNAVTATSETVTLVGSDVYHGGLQLAMNGKIYISNPFAFTSPTTTSLINNPNNALNPGIEAEAIHTNFGRPGYIFPQWVHWHVESCLQNVTLRLPDLNWVPYVHSYQDYIITNNDYSVHAEQDITMRAGNYIQLEPNTFIMPQSTFHAFIEDCSTSNRPGPTVENKKVMSTDNIGFSLYPNPTNDIVNLKLDNGKMQHITIISFDGKTIIDKSMNKTADYIFDVKQYSKGIYIVTIQTSEGKLFTKKLVVR